MRPAHMTRTQQPTNQLPTDMLERFRSRADKLNLDNADFHDDHAELRSVGYLAAGCRPSSADGASTSRSWRRASAGSTATPRRQRSP